MMVSVRMEEQWFQPVQEGTTGGFAVLAEESEDEAEPELLSQRRRVVPSVPSTVLDPVRPTEVDMESGSTLNLFFHPHPEVKRFPRWRWIQSRSSFLYQHLQ